MKKVNAIIERAGDGTYSVYTKSDDLEYLLNGAGGTVAEAKQEFMEEYEEMRAYYAEEGKPFTEVEMVYKYDVPSFLSYYSKTMSMAGLSRITGINQKQLAHYVSGYRHPSAATKEKISKAIHAFAEDLGSVSFV